MESCPTSAGFADCYSYFFLFYLDQTMADLTISADFVDCNPYFCLFHRI